jgi:hypothetical protein
MPETPTTTTTTTTESEIDRNAYRFSGVRYQLQGSSTVGPSWMVAEEPGFMTYPRSEGEE